MIKKLLTLFLAFSVIFGTLNLPVIAEENGEELASYEKFGLGIGCFSEDEYAPDEPMSRAEFAKVIANICNLVVVDNESEWEESVYGDKNDSETVEISNVDNIFDDVDLSHPYHEEIKAVYNKKYMVGISERRFAPDYDISVREVSKVLIDMLGYAGMAKWYGGYPAGYEQIAREINILNGVRHGYDDIATQKDVLNILYNVMDEKIIEVYFDEAIGYRENPEGYTFMNSVLGMYRERGILFDNGITSVSGNTTINIDEIQVGEIVAVLPTEMDSYRKLIGRDIEMYYKHDKYTEENTVVYMTVLEDDESITISADDFASFDLKTGIFSYNKNGRIVTEKVSASANMIYNNKMKTSPYKETDLIFETGDITLCNISGSEYDLIIVNNYETVYVTGVSSIDKTVSNGLTGGKKLFTLTEKEYADFISIKDENSNPLTFNDITVGSVLNVMECSGGIEIIVSKNVVNNFSLKSFRMADSRERGEWERKEISNDTNTYEILKSYYNMSTAVNLNAREKYTLYLDMNGNVAWMEAISGEENNMGILTRPIYSEDDEKAYVKIYTKANEIKTYEVAEKYYVNDIRKNKTTIETEMTPFVGKVVLYNLNQEGQISAFTTPADFADNSNKNRGWHLLNEEGEYHYGTNGKDFDKQFYFVSGKTTVFTMPDSNQNNEYSDVDNFSVNISSFEDGGKITVEAYASSPDAVEAEVIVWKKPVSGETSGGSSINTRSAFLIQDIYAGLNMDGQPIYYIDGYEMTLNQSNANYKTLALTEDVTMLKFDSSNHIGKPIDPDSQESELDVGPKTPQDLEAGDIIRYNTNIKGDVDYIAIAYDCVPGYDNDGNPIKGKSYHNGSIYGDGVSRDKYAEGATYSGDIMSRYESGIKINVSRTLKPSQLVSQNDIKANVRAFRLSGIPVLVVRKNGRGNIEITQGSAADGLAYNTHGQYDRVALVGHMTSLLYGAVIYK